MKSIYFFVEVIGVGEIMGFLGWVSERRRVECSTLDRWQMPGRDYNLKSISFDLRGSRHQTLDHSELSDIKINILPPTVQRCSYDMSLYSYLLGTTTSVFNM